MTTGGRERHLAARPVQSQGHAQPPRHLGRRNPCLLLCDVGARLPGQARHDRIAVQKDLRERAGHARRHSVVGKQVWPVFPLETAGSVPKSEGRYEAEGAGLWDGWDRWDG